MIHLNVCYLCGHCVTGKRKRTKSFCTVLEIKNLPEFIFYKQSRDLLLLWGVPGPTLLCKDYEPPFIFFKCLPRGQSFFLIFKSGFEQLFFRVSEIASVEGQLSRNHSEWRETGRKTWGKLCKNWAENKWQQVFWSEKNLVQIIVNMHGGGQQRVQQGVSAHIC